MSDELKSYVSFSTVTYINNLRSVYFTTHIDHALEFNMKLVINVDDSYLDTYVIANENKLEQYLMLISQTPKYMDKLHMLKQTYDYFQLDLTEMLNIITKIDLTNYINEVNNYISNALQDTGTVLSLMHPLLTADFYRKNIDHLRFNKYYIDHDESSSLADDYPINNLPVEIANEIFQNNPIYNPYVSIRLPIDSSCAVDTIARFSADFKTIDLHFNDIFYHYQYYLFINKHVPDWFLSKYTNEFLYYERRNEICLERRNANKHMLSIILENIETMYSNSISPINVNIDIINKYVDKFNFTECSGSVEFYDKLILPVEKYYQLRLCNDLPMEFIDKYLLLMSSFNPVNSRLTNEFILKNCNYITLPEDGIDSYTFNDWKITDDFAHKLIYNRLDLLYYLLMNRHLTSEFYKCYQPYNITDINHKANIYLIKLYMYHVSDYEYQLIINSNHEICDEYIFDLHMFKNIPLSIYYKYNIKCYLERIDPTPPISDAYRIVSSKF